MNNTSIDKLQKSRDECKEKYNENTVIIKNLKLQLKDKEEEICKIDTKLDRERNISKE